MKRVGLNKISRKHAEEIKLRQSLKQQLIDEYGSICMNCHGKYQDWRGVSLSHVIPLSRGGETSQSNCLLECYPCHSLRHGIVEI